MHPQAVAATRDAPDDAWRIDGLADRLALLRLLRDTRQPLVLQAATAAAMSARLDSLDEHAAQLRLVCSDEHPHLDDMLERGELMVTAWLDSVKLQFDLHDLVLVRQGQGPALHAPLPECIFRFQRRNAYRVAIGGSLVPTARFRHPGLPDMHLALRLLDVSCDGCSLWLPSDVPPLQPGTELARVLVVLDETTRLLVRMRLQHASVFSRGGAGMRLGCEWQPLDPQAGRALQRWIDRAQRRNRLLGQP